MYPDRFRESSRTMIKIKGNCFIQLGSKIVGALHLMKISCGGTPPVRVTGGVRRPDRLER